MKNLINLHPQELLLVREHAMCTSINVCAYLFTCIYTTLCMSFSREGTMNGFMKFTPLVFSATGGMAPAATVTYQRLASLLADKHQQDNSKTISWLCSCISFSLVRSAVMCLRGARSSYHRLARQVECEVPLYVDVSEGRVPSL